MIKKPFMYMGDKGRFYKEIKSIFKDSKKKIYVDLFAGGLTVPINLKNDIKDIKVVANVKDDGVEALIKIKNIEEVYKNFLEEISQCSFEKVKNEYKTEKWESLKERYKDYILKLDDDKASCIKLLCSFNNSFSLGSRYYSPFKL